VGSELIGKIEILICFLPATPGDLAQ